MSLAWARVETGLDQKCQICYLSLNGKYFFRFILNVNHAPAQATRRRAPIRPAAANSLLAVASTRQRAPIRPGRQGANGSPISTNFASRLETSIKKFVKSGQCPDCAQFEFPGIVSWVV
jgi:hypothetical protein